jgi:Multiubiquitin
MAAAQTDTQVPNQDRSDERGAAFVFDVDDATYEHDRPTITGAEIMAIAGISPSDGLIQILPDGTRKTVAPDETVHLVPGAQFKRRPRFKRG